MRNRVCGAILRDETILMVHHQEIERDYWTLPGGGIEPGETPEEAVAREVIEETGLEATVTKFLFEDTYAYGTSRCFLLEANKDQEAELGYDPEEFHVEKQKQMLTDVAWRPLALLHDDIQVKQVIQSLSGKA